MTSNFPFCQLVVLDWRRLPLNFPRPAADSLLADRFMQPGNLPKRSPSTLTGKLRCHELPLCSQRNGQTGLSTGRRLTVQIPLSRSATCVAESSMSQDTVRLRGQGWPARPRAAASTTRSSWTAWEPGGHRHAGRRGGVGHVRRNPDDPGAPRCNEHCGRPVQVEAVMPGRPRRRSWRGLNRAGRAGDLDEASVDVDA